MGKSRLLVVKDRPGFPQGLCLLLKFEKGVECSGQSKGGLATLNTLEKIHTGVILVDIRVLVLTGTYPAKGIGERCPRKAVIMLNASGGRYFK